MNLTMPWTATNGHTNGAADKIDDVRNVLGREAEHLAQVAAQIGRDAGTHADSSCATSAHDAQKQTNAAVNRFADIAAALGPSIAAIGRQRVRQVGEQAQSLGQELRQVRITTEPKKNDSTTRRCPFGRPGHRHRHRHRSHVAARSRAWPGAPRGAEGATCRVDQQRPRQGDGCDRQRAQISDHRHRHRQL